MPRSTASKKSCDQCLATTANNTRCKRRVCHGNLCWSHAQRYLRVRIKPSPIGGKGLFAQKINKKASDTVFKKNERIAEYVGKFRTSLSGKFDDYVLQVGKNKFIDAYRTNHGFARYVNDCRKTGKKCNAELVVNSTSNTGYVRAKRKIKNGEEILASYGKEYWRGYNGGNERNASARKQTGKKTVPRDTVEFDDVEIPFQRASSSPPAPVATVDNEIAAAAQRGKWTDIPRLVELQRQKALIRSQKRGKYYTREQVERSEAIQQEVIQILHEYFRIRGEIELQRSRLS